MKLHDLIRIGFTASLLIFSSTQAAEGDAEWQRVKMIIDGMKDPKVKPTSRDEAIEMFRAGLTDLDLAMAAAQKVAPEHPLRWEAVIFETMAGGARKVAGVTAPEGPQLSLEDLLTAPDAPQGSKVEASFIMLMETSEKLEASGEDTSTWMTLAEQHLKSFPSERFDATVKARMASFQARADLKTKPMELKFVQLDGSVFDIASLRGKVVLVDFWATWCGPCIAELPHVIQAYQKLHDKGFEIVGISLDSDKVALQAFLAQRGMTWPQYFDGKGWQNDIATHYGIKSIPAMWLVNKKGMVVSMDAQGTLEEQILKLLAEK